MPVILSTLKELKVGMGRYEKYVHREVAKTVPIPGFRVLVNPKQTWTFPVPHSLGKYFQHHEIQKHCTSTKFRILSEHGQLYKVPKNV